ncbi:hypothetical protein ACP275_07G096700 [Erythranthe tilingii]
MASTMKKTCMVLIAAVLVTMVAVVPRGEAAIGCGAVVSYMKPCLPYVTGNSPLGGCCGGIKSLNSAAKTTTDRQSVCVCLKSLASSFSGVNFGKAAGLPATCGVNIPYKISPSTDCSKYAYVYIYIYFIFNNAYIRECVNY